MGLLFFLLAAIAGLIFLAAPFWAAVGYLVVLAWTGWLLWLIFYRPDPISLKAADHDS